MSFYFFAGAVVLLKIVRDNKLKEEKTFLFPSICYNTSRITKEKEVFNSMRKNLQKAAGSHFGKPIWLISMIKPPKNTEITENI